MVAADASRDAANTLGDHLRARRALVAPEQWGLPVTPRRRVPGLTREELATVAGISAEYYVRLEQGRDRHPSPQVLGALATALRLDATATTFLLELGRDRSALEAKMSGGSEAVPRGILELMHAWDSTPAFVLGRFGDVLAANPMVAELTPACRAGANMFREIFLDPESRRRYVNWYDFTAVLAASLRAAAGPDVDRAELIELVAELGASDRFDELWSRQDIAPRSGGRTLIEHPAQGRIELLVETLAIPGGELSLVIYHGRPGSPDEAALHRLAAALPA